MKKYIIPSIMILTVILLIIAIIITKDKTANPNYYNGTYTKITTNIVDDNEYSKTSEIYTINKNNWYYKKIINYSNYQRETISVNLSGTIENNKFKLTTGEEVYIEKNRICFDESKKNCISNKTLEEENNLNDFNYLDHIFKIDNVDDITSRNEFAYIVFTINSCSTCKTYQSNLIKALYDYDIDFYIFDLTNATKDEIRKWNNYNGLESFPTTYIYKNGVIIKKIDDELSIEKIYQVLLDYGIKSR